MTDPNTLFLGRPDYIGPVTGHFGLLHHDQLFEHSENAMERVQYVKKEKPAHEIEIRLHNMIYLDPTACPAVAKCAPLDVDYLAKLAPLDAEILTYIRTHIPDCTWDGTQLVFPT